MAESRVKALDLIFGMWPCDTSLKHSAHVNQGFQHPRRLIEHPHGPSQSVGEKSTRMGFEPMRAEHNGLAVHRLNLSATSSFPHSKMADPVTKSFSLTSALQLDSVVNQK